MTGGMLSITVTKFVQKAALPQQSVACQMALMVLWHPVVLVERLATDTNTFDPQQMSKAVGLMKDHVVPHCTVWLLAQVITGGTVSMIVTVWLQVALLLQQSVASQLLVMTTG